MLGLAPHDLPDHLLSTGVNTFTLTDATRLLQRSEDAVRKGLERLRRKRLIFSPARGFYVVIPPQFRCLGAVPATHFIDAMMHALDRRYYVSLVSAAELHSAADPAHVQVMVDRHLTSRDLGTTVLRVYRSRYLRYDIGIDQHNGPTGPSGSPPASSPPSTSQNTSTTAAASTTSQHSSTPSSHSESQSSPRSPQPETPAPSTDSATSSDTSTPTSTSTPSQNSPTSTNPPPPTSPPAHHDADTSTPTGTYASTRRSPHTPEWKRTSITGFILFQGR